MMTALPDYAKRVLAIDPTTKGFGFAVLEGAAVLIDWSFWHPMKHPSDLNSHCLKKVAQLISRHQPEVLIAEDATARGSQRNPRVCKFIEDLVAMASDRHLPVRCIPRRRVLQCFSAAGAPTKRRVAAALTQRFPELEPHLPPLRKCFMTEDERMSIFDAVALVITFYSGSQCGSRTLPSPPDA
jgi:Holliday junction resolvasome RuvABC endonuclease subunit